MPADHVSAAGVPMGYNAALLAALAKRMEVNLAIVSVESGARFAALGADTIDLLFWQAELVRDEALSQAQYDVVGDFQSISGSVTASEPYGEQGMAVLVLKAQQRGIKQGCGTCSCRNPFVWPRQPSIQKIL